MILVNSTILTELLYTAEEVATVTQRRLCTALSRVCPPGAECSRERNPEAQLANGKTLTLAEQVHFLTRDQ
jgi:hypothetical protein